MLACRKPVSSLSRQRWRSPLSARVMLACTVFGACAALAIGAATP
ncbi:hypothetical protein [Xanthomonas translucens]|uniref:Uncharacterized protein n=1 Tax=Xanthomonas translucens pv. translucens TaxID=134875 RepID=A0ABW9KX72_XANCT|nr:hypothetical protein [Xanthomonas translucens]MCT8285596.1 hypothetical protein [Xanthomonas translucens pv. translucens]MCT8303254.1 hypothetical protein [Xanthomonas translucens pv. translucens]CCP40452.1 hypothetical protein BN444_02175 [Xanthomonas translucens pv. translucens DSM 18974]